MKEKIILSIAALDVPMEDLKADIAVAKEKYFYRDFCFTWATVLGLLNEIVDKNKVINIAGVSVNIKEIVLDVEAAKNKFHYNDFSFTWPTVEALCDVVESQYTFNGLYFFYNEEGVKQVQKSKELKQGDWFAIQETENTYQVMRKEGGIMKLIKRLMDFELRHFVQVKA